MRITKVELEKHQPISRDVIVISTLEGRQYRILDCDIEHYLDTTGELEDVDREEVVS